MASPNPYTPVLLTYNPRRFYGREKEITSILQVITAAEPGGHAIYGIRTIGKTLLLKYLKDRNGAVKQYANFVSAEYQAGGDRRLFFVYVSFHTYTEGKHIFHVLLEQLDEELENDELVDLIQFPHYDEETPRQDCVHILRRILIKLDHHDVRVVFLLDDFDNPLQSIDHYDDGLLRTLTDYAALIIATEEPISELRPDFGASSPLLGILRPEAVGLISEQAARQLICNPAGESGVAFTEDEETFLLNVAGRHPFLLTAACELYFEMRTEYPDLAQRLLEPSKRENLQTLFLSRLSSQLHVSTLLHASWSRLKPEEHRTLHTVTTVAKLDLTGELGKIAVRLDSKGLIYWDVKHNVYRIFSLLFGEFVRQNYGAGAEITHSKSVHPTDNLTPIDRALLRYFLNYPDRICTFEEILDAVWEDGEKSKRALEAAVHRLRKALAPDEQLKSVRGIGYKFIPGSTTFEKSLNGK